MDKKFCVECGTQINIDARFCRACGRRQPEMMIPPELFRAPNVAAPVNVQAEPVKAEPVKVGAEVAETAAEVVDEVAAAPVEEISEAVDETAAETVEDAAEEIRSAGEAIPPVTEPPKPEPRPVPDYRSYLNNGEPEQPQVDEIPEPKSEGGINPAYILLIGCSLFLVALLVWAIFATNKLNMTHQSKDKSSSASISIVKPTEPPVTTAKPKKGGSSSKSGGSEYSGVGGKAVEFVKSGKYTVGEDVKAGTYIFISDEQSMFGEDAYEDEEYIPSFYAGVYNDAYEEARVHTGWFQCSTYMKLEDGQMLDFSWAKAYPADSYDGENSPFEHAGMFCVGKDLTAGTYKLEALTDQGYENYTVYSSIEDVMSDVELINREYGFDKNETVTLTDGQYIQLEWCRLKK